jgi:hypothetical protein
MEARQKKNKKPEDKESVAGDDEEEEVKEEKHGDDIVPGALLRVKNIPKDFSREDFKTKWYEATNESEFRVSIDLILSEPYS